MGGTKAAGHRGTSGEAQCRHDGAAGPDHRRSAEALRVRVAVETACPEIAAARNLLDQFRTMVVAKKTDDLTPWFRDAVGSEIVFFLYGIGDDEAAVRAAIVEPWSNGQTEGQVTRPKLVKRQVSGRANIDLLRARMVQPG